MCLSSNKVVGLKQSKRVIEAGSALKAFVAMDSDGDIKESFVNFCKENNTPVEYVETMLELGSACNIDVGAAVVTILKNSD